MNPEVGVLLTLAMAGVGLWVVMSAKSEEMVKFGVVLCAVALVIPMMGIISAMRHGDEDRCRAAGGVPVSTGRPPAINCSNQHGGYIDRQVWDR